MIERLIKWLSGHSSMNLINASACRDALKRNSILQEFKVGGGKRDVRVMDPWQLRIDSLKLWRPEDPIAIGVGNFEEGATGPKPRKAAQFFAELVFLVQRRVG